MNKLLALRIATGAQALIVTFWWFLSHWFFSDWYHGLLGFEPGSYDDDFVKIIGTMALIPMVGLTYATFRPLESRGYLLAHVVWSFAMAATYLYTIHFGHVPAREYGNAATLVVTGIALIILFPPAPARAADV